MIVKRLVTATLNHAPFVKTNTQEKIMVPALWAEYERLGQMITSAQRERETVKARLLSLIDESENGSLPLDAEREIVVNRVPIAEHVVKASIRTYVKVRFVVSK